MAKKSTAKAKAKETAKEEKEIVQQEKPVARPTLLPASSWDWELEHVFDDFRRFFFPRWWRPERRLLRGDFIQPPVIDVVDEKNHVVVKAELPGLSKEDVEVEISDSRLTIKGEKRRVKEIKEAHYYRSEREYGSVYRSVELPVAVKTENVKATFKDGVLEVRLPKTEEAKRKTVKVAVQS